MNEHVKLEKAKPTRGGSSNKLPVAFVGNNDIRCYSCGVVGHKKGDVSCKAGRNDIHHSAPQAWKDRQASRGNGQYKPGRSSGGYSPGTKKYCNLFNGGKGSCSYGDKRKFSHDTAPGRATMLSPGKSTGGKFSPNQKKQISTMMSSQMKRAFKSAADS